MNDDTREGLDKKLADPSIRDFLEMTAVEFAVHTRGAAQSGSTENDFYRKLMQAKVSDAICTAVYELERSTTRATEELNRTTERLVGTTARLVFATWVLVAFTGVLAIATIRSLLEAMSR